MGLFAIRDYRRLFSAQVIALFGTGLATVALGLLAYDLAGQNAGAVLGTALTIKMVMYVLIAPLAAAYADRLPRRLFLVLLDVARALVVLALPFVTEVWHIYLLIGILQASSAAFTPTFQATIPDIVTKESDYTRVSRPGDDGGSEATERTSLSCLHHASTPTSCASERFAWSSMPWKTNPARSEESSAESVSSSASTPKRCAAGSVESRSTPAIARARPPTMPTAWLSWRKKSASCDGPTRS